MRGGGEADEPEKERVKMQSRQKEERKIYE